MECLWSYATLLGKVVDLGRLTPVLRVLVSKICSLVSDKSGQDRRGVREAGAYAKEARDLIDRSEGFAFTSAEILAGPVGDVYRDCYYRIVANDFDEKKREEFIQRVKFNPARLLIDRYLDEWEQRGKFAKDGEVGPSTISRIFKYILEGSGAPQFSLERFSDACRSFSIVPSLTDTSDNRNQMNPEELAARPTMRDLQVISLAAAVGSALVGRAKLDADARNRLCKRIRLVFGITANKTVLAYAAQIEGIAKLSKEREQCLGTGCKDVDLVLLFEELPEVTKRDENLKKIANRFADSLKDSISEFGEIRGAINQAPVSKDRWLESSSTFNNENQGECKKLDDCETWKGCEKCPHFSQSASETPPLHELVKN